ncbi:MAG: PEP-utilizing enzyme [Microthrixaceae bacterium]
MTGIGFAPPGKGQWISLRDHFPRAVTPEYASLLPWAMSQGEAIAFAEYGLPVKTLTVGLVHGHVYVTPEPLVGRASSSLPPSPLLWIAARLIPAFRRRNRAARLALATRPWLVDAARWHATERAEWVAANRAVQQEDPAAMDAVALADHLLRARAHARAGYLRHFALHGPDLIPTGLLLARCASWGVGADEVLPVLRGSSPASLGGGPELDALRAAVATTGRRPGSIDDLRALVPLDLEAFLATHGWRLVTGYDLDASALIELPDLVVTLACTAPARPVAQEGDAPLDALRATVPAAEMGDLDRLVADARATFGMRDDNGGLTGAWPVGLLRRGMLAAGALLCSTGAIDERADALEVTVEELVALLGGDRSMTASDIARARERRRERSSLVPPLQLGPTLDVPLRVLPGPMRTMSEAQLTLRDTFTASLDGRAELTGDGIGRSAYQGRACVAEDPADALARLEPGDVLVALGTTPAFNMALSIAGAVVVEEGGLLSHAAVIARELGLPAVVGAAGAMASIPDGSIVEVDPLAGLVRVLVAPVSPRPPQPSPEP